jgi:hypothetical protein
MKDKDIALSAEHPEADVRHIVRGIVRRGLKPVSGRHLFRFAWMRTFSNGFERKVLDIKPR